MYENRLKMLFDILLEYQVVLFNSLSLFFIYEMSHSGILIVIRSKSVIWAYLYEIINCYNKTYRVK